MKPFLHITRYAYEEPYHIQLVIVASNGRQRGGLELYLGAGALAEWADAFRGFPQHREQVYLWEVGSERPEDRWAYYMRLRVMVADSRGQCVLHLRFNNNRELPDREISEFCIPIEAAALNRLGELLASFARLEHEVLWWTPLEGELFRNPKEAAGEVFE